MIFNEIVHKPRLAKKFYFLDYFLILLNSCENFEERNLVFKRFKDLKEKERLGESKYRKLTTDETLTDEQLKRYEYTFNQVIIESENYGLVNRVKDRIKITNLGRDCLEIGKKTKSAFYFKMLELMESASFAFHHLVNFCYEQNRKNNGLLVFPIYSPRKLNFEKSEMTKSGDWHTYISRLTRKLQIDAERHLDKEVNLDDASKNLAKELVNLGVISENVKDPFNQANYNITNGFIRRFWLNYFLRDIYGYPHSFDTLNIWAERGKQLGIVHSTDFYPDFDGRLVFPTSIITSGSVKNDDFKSVFTYPNNEVLYIHSPIWDKKNKNKENINQEAFVKSLVNAYFDLRKNRRSTFVRISDVREKVCYKMRVSHHVFNDFLEEAYLLNLRGELSIQISLEADRLPQETGAMYLKREPVLINDQYKNIIAINIKQD